MSDVEAAAPEVPDLGVYVHVPFCRHLCPYCDFNVWVEKHPAWDALAAAIGAELSTRAPCFEGRRPGSIYFGGGTPSLAPAAWLLRVVERIRDRVGLAEDAELSLELEPGTSSQDVLAELRRAGFNRISLGWQSTHDRLLRSLGRAHDAAASAASYAAARAAGFTNVSVDLIFAVPGQSLADLDADLDAILRLNPEHVSLYALTFHAGTELERRRQAGRVVPVDEGLELEMMNRIEVRLLAGGFRHYEVSNYARPGFASRHNRIYWTGGWYLGLGPGAHSFVTADEGGSLRGHRWEGVRDPTAYRRVWSGAPSTGIPESGDASVSFVERLDHRQLLTERMATALRTDTGIDLAPLDLGDQRERIDAAASDAIARGWLTRNGTHLVATPEGLRLADSLALLFA